MQSRTNCRQRADIGWRASSFYAIRGVVRFASPHVFTFSVLATFTLFAGCASDDVMSVTDDAATDARTDAAASTDAGKKDVATGCVDQCKVNADCANSCPASSGGSHCCDTGSGKCYAFASATCPADVVPAGDSGVTPPY